MAEPIHVSVGTEPMQWLPALVLRSSIVRRASRPVLFSYSWLPDRWHSAMEACRKCIKRPEVFGGTQFNLWRWMLPSVYQNQGRVIYLDTDQVVLADIGELWDSLPVGKAIAAVKNAVGVFGEKQPEPGAWQTSVMVMDCRLCDWEPAVLLRKCETGSLEYWHGRQSKTPYSHLMQAKWIQEDRLHELPPGWNHFGCRLADTKLLHWSHVASQPYRHPEHPTAEVFRQELRASLEAGHVEPADVRRAVGLGHLHKSYKSLLR